MAWDDLCIRLDIQTNAYLEKAADFIIFWISQGSYLVFHPTSHKNRACAPLFPLKPLIVQVMNTTQEY